MKIRLALEPRTSDGEYCPTPVVRLRVRDRFGSCAEIKFRVDTQADATAIPISLADREAIAFARTRPGTARGITGRIQKFRDRIHVVIAGKEHNWPCDFTESAVDPESKRPLPDLPPVLGRAGLLDKYAVTADSGYLIITRIGKIRRWLRRRLHELWTLCGMIQPEDRAL